MAAADQDNLIETHSVSRYGKAARKTNSFNGQKLMARYTLAVLLLAFPAILAAQEPEAKEINIVLEEPAKTVEEAMQRRDAKEAEAQKQLDAAQKLFDDTMAAADRHAVADLSVIARQSVADGKLTDAAEAWTEVLELDPDNATAKAFFRTIRRPDVVQKRTGRGRSFGRSPISGTWRGRWGTTGNAFSFDFGAGDESVKLIDGRYLQMSPGATQYVEVIPLGDRMLVLGWSTGKGRSPTISPASMKGIPDHVGIALPVR